MTILLDEDIDGYASYLSRVLSSPEWIALTVAIDLHVATFADVGLAKGILDQEIWRFCQDQQIYLVTNNRNKDSPTSLEATIRVEGRLTSLPVLTISDIDRFRTDTHYVDAVVAKLFEYLIDSDNLVGTGRLYLP